MERINSEDNLLKKKHNPYPVKRYTQKEILAMDKDKGDRMMFEVPLEFGKSGPDGEREVINEITYIDGHFFHNGREVRFAVARELIKKFRKDHLLNEEHKKRFGFYDFSKDR